MYVVVWLTVAAVVGGLAVLFVSSRRNRQGDLGSVSGSWIAQHRD